MAFYIDSADRRVITELWATGVFAGVTTNPTLLSRAGLSQNDLPALHGWLVEQRVPTIFLQVMGTTVEEMSASARWLRALSPAVVKVPSSPAGLTVARALVEDGCQVLLTAVYHPVQALLGQAIGVRWVAPYVGRMTDAGRPGVPAVVQMQQALGHGRTQVLAASLRSADQVSELAAAGVAHFTLGAATAREILHDDLTAAAVAEFEAATPQAAVVSDEADDGLGRLA